MPTSYGVSSTFNIGDLAPYHEEYELRTIPFQEGGIEPSQGSGCNNESQEYPSNTSNVMNNTLELEASELASDSELASILNKKDFQCNTYIQGNDELIKGNQIQMNEATKEQNPTEISKTDQQQSLTPITDQATLVGPPRRDLSPWDDVEGRFGISTHGPSCHGPRTLLEVIKGGLKSKLKVTQAKE